MPLPLYPDLPFIKRPWTTLAIIAACFVLHLTYEVNYWTNNDLAYAITQEEFPALKEAIPHKELINIEELDPESPHAF